jgi:SUMO ligase MMS21 Smc5/6 complex component
MQVEEDVDHMLVLRQPVQVAQAVVVPVVYHLLVVLVQSTQVAAEVEVDTPVDLAISKVVAPAVQALLLFHTHPLILT